jgi:Holliday junction resolvasome RuvABC endonuclease subunit
MTDPTTALVLAIDPATRCGFAWGSRRTGIEDATWRRLVDDRLDHPGQRYTELLDALEPMGLKDPDLVLYEHAHHRGRAATAYHYGYIATIERWACEVGIPAVGVHSATIKAHTGDGRADKAAMIRFARLALKQDTGRDRPDLTHDEADAIALLDYALRTPGFLEGAL